MAADKALLQFLSILPYSEYDVKKHTCSTRKGLDRDQILLMIRRRYDHLHLQRKEGGGRNDTGYVFVVDAKVPGTSGGKRNNPRGVRGHEDRGRGGPRDWGENEKQKDDEDVEDAQTTTRNIGDENVDGDKEGSTTCNHCGKVGHNTVRCPGHVCGVCGRKDHSAEICANVVTVLTCEEDAKVSVDKTLSGKEDEAFVCDLPCKSFDVPGERVVLHLLGRWGISR